MGNRRKKKDAQLLIQILSDRSIRGPESNAFIHEDWSLEKAARFGRPENSLTSKSVHKFVYDSIQTACFLIGSIS